MPFKDYWENVSQPSLHSFLEYWKKKVLTGCLNKDFEYLNYVKDLDHIIAGYKCGTTWNKIALAAKRNLQVCVKNYLI